MAQAGPQPGGVVIAPHERQVWLVHEVVDDSVAAAAPVPAIAADDQLVHRQVSDQADRVPYHGQGTIVTDEGIDKSVVIRGRMRARRLVQQFLQEVAILRRYDLRDPGQWIAARKKTHNLE